MQVPIPERHDRFGRIEPTDRRVFERPVQLGLPFYGKDVLVDGIVDEARQISYLGKATHVFDNLYKCLAVVGGALCVVEVTISFHDHVPPTTETRV